MLAEESKSEGHMRRAPMLMSGSIDIGNAVTKKAGELEQRVGGGC